MLAGRGKGLKDRVVSVTGEEGLGMFVEDVGREREGVDSVAGEGL